MAIFSLFFIFFINFQVQAVITPSGPYLVQALSDSDPPVMAWNSNLAYYENHLLYVGSDNKLYGYDLANGVSSEVYDFSGDPNFSFGAAGLLVASDGYLYFNDNGNTSKIYRIHLADAWPIQNIESIETSAKGSIWSSTTKG